MFELGVSFGHHGPAPDAPTLAVVDAGSGTVTATVTGTGTIRLYYALLGAASWTTGNSRSGSGTISQALTAGLAYQFIAVASNEGVYSLPSSVQRILLAPASGSIIERISQYLAAAIGDITEALGFSETITAVRPKRVHFWDEITADATCIIAQGQPERLDMSYGTIDWKQPFALQVVLMDSDAATDPIETRLNNVRSDIEKKLMENITCGGLAYDLQINPPDYYSGETFTGVAVNCDVYYRTALTDPYTLA